MQLQRLVRKSLEVYLHTLFVPPACAGVGAVTVVETLHLGDVQGGEDGVTGEGHAGVHGGHHPLGGVDSKAGSAKLNILTTFDLLWFHAQLPITL